MNNFAPWEDPNLSAPAATLEHVIEKRVRRFALWKWDGRLVWRDRYFRELWWASRDEIDGDLVGAWKRVVDSKRFGRALASKDTGRGHFGGSGSDIDAGAGVRYSMQEWVPGAYHIICDALGAGQARLREYDGWWDFEAREDSRPRHQMIRSNGQPYHSVWWPGLQFPHLKSAFTGGFGHFAFGSLPAPQRAIVRAGDASEPMLLLRDWTTWQVQSQRLWQRSAQEAVPYPERSPQWHEALAALNRKAPLHFGLPTEAKLEHSSHSLGRSALLRLVCTWNFGLVTWEIKLDHSIGLEPSMHDVLETQLHLRDTLRPILTAAEIATLFEPVPCPA